MEDMITKDVLFCGVPVTFGCDGQCHKAWGIQYRPRVQLSANVDDYAYLADHEVGFAPADPGTSEGPDSKPCNTVMTDGQRMNKWCARQCERSDMWKRGEQPLLRLFDERRYNIPSSKPR